MQNNKYLLEERTLKFSKNTIRFVRSIKLNFYNNNILSQLLKSGTSIGANYQEANGAESKKDFIHKIAICKKEAKETGYWLELLSEACPETLDSGRAIRKESNELILIFAKIYSSSTIKTKN